MKFKMNAKTKTIKVNENIIDRLFKCASTPHLSMYKGLKKNKKNFSQSEKFMYICLVLAPPLLTENCMKFCDCTHARAHLPRTNICWHGSVCECVCECVCVCVCARAPFIDTSCQINNQYMRYAQQTFFRPAPSFWFTPPPCIFI